MKGNSMAKIVITYETITPESAEQGEAESQGWYLPGGWFHALRDSDGDHPAVLAEARAGAFDMRLSEALKEAESLGCYSAQLDTFRDGRCRLTIRSEDADHGDYSTAEETFYMLHVCDISAGTAARIKRVLSRRVRFY